MPDTRGEYILSGRTGCVTIASGGRACFLPCFLPSLSLPLSLTLSLSLTFIKSISSQDLCMCVPPLSVELVGNSLQACSSLSLSLSLSLALSASAWSDGRSVFDAAIIAAVLLLVLFLFATNSKRPRRELSLLACYCRLIYKGSIDQAQTRIYNN